MPEQTAMPDIAGSDINQDSMVDDFSGMNTEYLKSHSFVDKEGNAVEDNKTVEPEKPVVNKTVEPEKKEPDPPKKTIEDHIFTVNEKGEKTFNRDSAIGILQPKIELGLQPKSAQSEFAKAVTGQPENAEPQVPEWKKNLEEQRVYEQNMRTNLQRPLSIAQELIKQGADPQAAMAEAWRQVNETLAEHFEQTKAERQAKIEEAKYKAIEEREKQSEFRAKASANEGRFISALGSPELFQQMFFRPEYGGTAVWKMFTMANPDAKGLQGQELQQKYDRWWINFAADAENLSMIYDVARSKIALQNLPHLLQEAAQTKEKEIKKQASHSVIRPTGMVTQDKTQNQSKGDQDIAKYLGVDSLEELG